ncbi:MAG: hypothetical protein WA609_20310 [Terriglobales bacterium]
MTVAIVLDPGYPELESLAEQMPIWVINSTHHRSTAERWWQLRGCADASQGITVFKITDEKDAEGNCINIIGEVDLHHGIYSSGKPVSAVRVIGVRLSDAMREEFGRYGLVSFEPTLEGFVARTQEV